jgi:hypothetical protein
MKTLYKKQPEFELQKQICRYLSLQYPKILFISDATSGAKLTMPQAIRNGLIQKADFKIPDLQILEPNKNWHGLFLELKKESPYKKTGGIKASQNNHLELQEQSMKLLRQKGYMACFCWSFENAIEIIENYLKDV